jgi:hypothetical protein
LNLAGFGLASSPLFDFRRFGASIYGFPWPSTVNGFKLRGWLRLSKLSSSGLLDSAVGLES